MAIKNNVNVEAMMKTASAIGQDTAKGKRTNRVEGMWNLADGQPQFSAEISFEGGKLTLEADQPSFLGGGGTRPGPMHYALYGFASCFTATFVSMASLEGLELEEVKTAAEFNLNFSQVFGLSQEPIVEEVRVTLTVRGNADKEKLEKVLALAEERCPASFCLKNPIRLVARVAAA
ncbi:MAG: OsmC family protein [Chloroflexi bacterium]|nr:OsmC family protein [Chloroflexota bacterium]